jgi:pSer/pThr/pTyr-binding forkhead associated (FHA) protein
MSGSPQSMRDEWHEAESSSPMTIELVITTANGGERSFAVGERAVIGRENRCDLRVPLPTVSDEHCEIVVRDGLAELKDLGSESGTFHNGARVDRVRLSHADRFSVGSMTFEVRMTQNQFAGRTNHTRG